MTQEDYVSFETAKLLKEKGFPQKQENSGYYATEMVYCTTESKDGTHHFCHQYPACCDKKYEYICAPTQQVAMRWLREEHHIHIIAEPCLSHEEKIEELDFTRWFWTILKEDGEYKPIRRIDEFPNYEDAIEAAVKYCLENLV